MKFKISYTSVKIFYSVNLIINLYKKLTDLQNNKFEFNRFFNLLASLVTSYIQEWKIFDIISTT